MSRKLRIALRAIVVLVVATVIGLSLRDPYVRAATGSAIMLAAFIGWGEIVERWVLKSPTRSHWGLRAAWGMGATLAIGGFAGALHVAGRAMFVTQLAVGCGMLALSFVTSQRRFVSNRRVDRALASPATLALLAFAFFVLAIRTLGDAATQYAQPSDDSALYWPFAEDFLRTGTLVEPFCFRRVTTYGGQSYLHAIALLYSRHDQLFALDGGVGLAIVFGLVAGDALARPHSRGARLAMAIVVLFSLANVRQNVASLMTGVAACYALYVTTARIASRRAPGNFAWQEAAVVGVLLGSSIVLRTSNAIANCLFVAIALFGARGGLRRRWSRSELVGYLRDGVMCAGAFVVFMLPWSSMFHASIGTYVYPLSKGNLTPGFDLLRRAPGYIVNFKAIIANFTHDRPIVALLPFLVAGLVMVVRRDVVRGVVPAAVVSSLVGMVIMVVAGGTFDPDAMARYYFAYSVATALLVIASADLSPKRLDAAGVMVVVATFVHATLHREDTKRLYTETLDNIERALANGRSEAAGQEELTHRYRVIQSFVPAGEHAVTAVADPFRFDLARNELKLLDQPGGLGPSGFPVFGGPQAISQYLRDHGYRYMIVVSFYGGHELYDINHWRGFIHPPKPGSNERESYLSIDAPFQIAASESLEALRKSNSIYEDMGISVVDLAK